ncbi:MAG TPA: hypothetical protein VM054_09910 [bacterium]|nr:hypothetical protein [bacterium]
MISRLTVLYRCPACGRPGHGNLFGGALVCRHCGAAYAHYAEGAPTFAVVGGLNSGEAMLAARKRLRGGGHRGRLKLEADERLLVPWRLDYAERLVPSNGSFERRETTELTPAFDLDELQLAGADPLSPHLAEGAAGLTVEPLDPDALSASDVLFPPPPTEATESQDTVRSLTAYIYHPYWRVVFSTEGRGGADWPLVMDGLSGRIVAGDLPQQERTSPAFWIGVPTLGAYAVGTLVNLLTTSGLSVFEWVTLGGALAGIGGLFLLRARGEGKVE